MWRYELKFIVDNKRDPDLTSWIAESRYLRRHHPTRLINSLYFDAPDMRGATENLMGLPERRKIRLRWYGMTTGAPVRLEIKERNGRLGQKHAMDWPVPADQIDHRASLSIPQHDAVPASDTPLRPTLLVHYRRDYFLWDAGVRITVDRALKFAHPSLPNPKPIADPSAAIVEIKFPPHVKDRAHDLVAGVPFYPLRHSKYLRGLDLTGRAVYA